ncbi:hypothetical protein D9M71_633350 [compost metagenome]
MFQWALHVQQHQNETTQRGSTGARPQRLEAQGDADHDEEQGRSESLGDDELIDRVDLFRADALSGALYALLQQALAARTIDPQFLGPLGDGAIVFLQFIFLVAGLEEALDSPRPGEVLHHRADQDRQGGSEEHRRR